MFHYINQQCPIFAIHADPNDPTKILETCPRNWSVVSNLMFFYCVWVAYHLSREGNFHTILCCFNSPATTPIILLNSFELIC
jgi:hypothetical protein